MVSGSVSLAVAQKVRPAQSGTLFSTPLLGTKCTIHRYCRFGSRRVGKNRTKGAGVLIGSFGSVFLILNTDPARNETTKPVLEGNRTKKHGLDRGSSAKLIPQGALYFRVDFVSGFSVFTSCGHDAFLLKKMKRSLVETESGVRNKQPLQDLEPRFGSALNGSFVATDGLD